MIYLILVLAAVTAVSLLIRQDGALATEEEPPSSGSSRNGAVESAPSLTGEALRMEAVIVATLLGGSAAQLLRSLALLDYGGGLAVLTLLLVVVPPAIVLFVVFLLSGLWGIRSALHRQGFEPTVARHAFGVPALTRFAATLDNIGRSVAQTVRPESSQDDVDEASEQFSRVLSAEAEMSEEEEMLLRSAISLPRSSVRDVMVPRVAVVGIEAGTPWSEVLDRVRSVEHSRLPAFRNSLDDIFGVLVAKDLLPFALEERSPSDGWEQLVRPVAFVPATKPVADQLRDFRNSRTHLAVVVDEFGGTAGILTIEDVLEELVGEIRDEHDVEEPAVVTEDGTRHWVSGRMPIDELEEVLGESLGHEGASTVGGAVFERFARVPKVGEECNIGRYRVVVERMKRNAVDRVYMELMDPREARK